MCISLFYWELPPATIKHSKHGSVSYCRSKWWMSWFSSPTFKWFNNKSSWFFSTLYSQKQDPLPCQAWCAHTCKSNTREAEGSRNWILVSLKTTWATVRDPVSRKQKTKPNNKKLNPWVQFCKTNLVTPKRCDDSIRVGSARLCSWQAPTTTSSPLT